MSTKCHKYTYSLYFLIRLNTYMHACMLKYMLLYCFTPAVDVPSQQQLPLYNTHFATTPSLQHTQGILYFKGPEKEFVLSVEGHLQQSITV